MSGCGHVFVVIFIGVALWHFCFVAEEMKAKDVELDKYKKYLNKAKKVGVV